MSVNSISDLAHQQMLNILGQSPSSQAKSSQSSSITSSASTSFSQMLAELQQLETFNPGKYSKVSQLISANLSTAATSAQKQGHSALAANLSTLSKDFSDASQTGQLPNVSDLERVMQAARNGAKKAEDSANAALSAGSHSKGINIMNQIMSLAGF